MTVSGLSMTHRKGEEVQVLTLVTCRNMANDRLVRVAASTSTPMMMPLSMRTAVMA